MKKTIWTGITIALTIAILAVCTYFPNLFWETTFSATEEEHPSVSLELPAMDTFISQEETESKPNTEQTLVSADDSAYESEEGKSSIAAFSQLVNNALYEFFGISCNTQLISDHTTLWKETTDTTGQFRSSCTFIFQHGHVLWEITAHGSADKLTYLNRAPYNPTAEEKTISEILNHDKYTPFTDEEIDTEVTSILQSRPFLPETFTNYFPEAFDFAQYEVERIGTHTYKVSTEQYEVWVYTVNTTPKGCQLISFLSILYLLG